MTIVVFYSEHCGGIQADASTSFEDNIAVNGCKLISRKDLKMQNYKGVNGLESPGRKDSIFFITYYVNGFESPGRKESKMLNTQCTSMYQIVSHLQSTSAINVCESVQNGLKLQCSNPQCDPLCSKVECNCSKSMTSQNSTMMKEMLETMKNLNGALKKIFIIELKGTREVVRMKNAF